MTHDELLALINDEIKVCAPECMKHQWDNAPWIALRAVVELHTPTKRYPYCSHCWVFDGNGDSRRADYPCHTIQAIEKELG